MRYIILIMLSFFLTQFVYAAFGDEYTSPRSCSRECDPYNPENCNNTCTQDECSGIEFAMNGQCWTVDCSRTPENPIQVGNVCQAAPKCLPERYEYKNSQGECVKCQGGVFDNDTCNYCGSGQKYSAEYAQCLDIECAPDYELKDGMCQLKACPIDEIRDKYGVCVKKPTVPITCPPDHVLTDGKCVLVQQPITDCSTIAGSVECMTDSIFGAADKLNISLYSKLRDVLDLFTSISDALDNVPDTDTDTDDTGDKEVDTSALAADVPFHEIQKSDISDSIFTSRAQCPPDRIFTSWNSSYHFSYQKICDVLQKLSFIVMLLAFITSINIIVRD